MMRKLTFSFFLVVLIGLSTSLALSSPVSSPVISKEKWHPFYQFLTAKISEIKNQAEAYLKEEGITPTPDPNYP